MKPNALKAKTVFEDAIALADPCARRTWVENACGPDDTLRREVESLLDAYDRAGSFLQLWPTIPPPPSPTPHGAQVQRFGDYELLEEIARGGMGVVYKARQLRLNRIVAVKMILTGQLASESAVRRFRSEAQAVASLNHPNIVGIYEVGEHQGQHFYSMPFVEGRTLAQLVDSGQWQPGDGTEAARLIAKVARAAQHAHESGILHRDLKPGNILVRPDSEPCITDFGLAKRVRGEARVTLTGDVLGTPSFMAPEQARGRSGQATPANDIYSLGAVLYYLLTGRPPFVADSALDALLLALESEAMLPRRINPKVPPALERVCLRCLEKRPESRYASAAELAADLERFLKGESLPVNTKAIGRRVEAWMKRQPALAARWCTGLLCLAIVVTAYQLRHYESLQQHLEVIGVLLAWMWIAFLCQRGLESGRHTQWTRLIWTVTDSTALTLILWIAQAFESSLVVLYPALIAASGFWLQAYLVSITTGLCLGGYLLLLIDAVHRQELEGPFHWHLLAMVGTIVVGLSVAYLVNRVSALTRFYENRPRAEH